MQENAAENIQRNETKRRWETDVGGAQAVLDYTEADGSLRLTHTYVPGEFEGQGIGSALVRAAMEHARREGLTVVPVCPFVKVFVDRNPEYADLLSR